LQLADLADNTIRTGIDAQCGAQDVTALMHL